MYRKTSNKIPCARYLRYPKAFVSPYTINFLHLHNPWVSAWWSAAFPGFGHILLGSYAIGYTLLGWEVLINIKSKLNLAILYSLTGQFELAKATLDTRWLLLYLSVYIFSIWGCYRLATEINKHAILADREHSFIAPVAINSISINGLEKRNPCVAVAWSMLMPGIGHLYNVKIITGFFILGWWILLAYLSHLFEAIHLTATGAFSQAAAVINIEWFLFLPSLYCFAFYDSYVYAVEINKMFEREQAGFLMENYQDQGFEMPV